jgi:hypothetical protein
MKKANLELKNGLKTSSFSESKRNNLLTQALFLQQNSTQKSITNIIPLPERGLQIIAPQPPPRPKKLTNFSNWLSKMILLMEKAFRGFLNMNELFTNAVNTPAEQKSEILDTWMKNFISNILYHIHILENLQNLLRRIMNNYSIDVLLKDYSLVDKLNMTVRQIKQDKWSLSTILAGTNLV